ncbi:MAG: hypothetical protein ACI9FB_001919 [Candidatus Azotimanducaceae bacterium]|jgi:hypothetical protein
MTDKIPLKIHGTFDQPTVFHITHYKSGSQWVAEILKWCAYRRAVLPEEHSRHFNRGQIVQGLIYPTVYRSAQDFDQVLSAHKNLNWRAFGVIRDIRDTLISLYFSVLKSHSDGFEDVRRDREVISSLSKEDGLIYLIMGDGQRPSYAERIAEIQSSWVKRDYPIFKYEDILADELGSFRKILNHCEIDFEEDYFNMVVNNNSFQSISGREKGIEDSNSHFRKGISGDWKNHFTPKVIELIKQRYGELLILTRYEERLDW